MAPKTATTAAPKTAAAPKAAKAAKADAPKKAAVAADGDAVKKTLSPVPMPLAAKVAKSLQEDAKSRGEDFKVTQKDVKAICECFVKTIISDTIEGNTVALPNYLTFKRVLRKERTHKNPQTKEAIVKPAHYVLCMDVKAALKKQFEEVKVNPEDLNKPKKAAPVKSGGDADVASHPVV
jgi:nucleoid DNA-binding protein